MMALLQLSDPDMSGRIQDAEADREDRLEALADMAAVVLKHRNLYGIFDALGNIDTRFHGDHGLYLHCTRFLSRYRLSLGKMQSPIALNSDVGRRGVGLFTNLTNAPAGEVNGRVWKAGDLHLYRQVVLFDRQLHEKVEVTNETHEELRVDLVLEWEGDFKDLFEIRGAQRKRRGRYYTEDFQTQAYEGLDELHRNTRLTIHGAAAEYRDREAVVSLRLAAGQTQVFTVAISCHAADQKGEKPEKAPKTDFLRARKGRVYWSKIMDRIGASMEASDPDLQRWLDQSRADIALLLTETEHGIYPFAGIPWFCAAFGRDGLTVALQTLWFAPGIARGTLTFLAAHQATTTASSNESAPGKIIHEVRQGEMVNLGEVPYGRYYGTVDATPMFVWLLGLYILRTGDLGLLRELEPNLLRAIALMDSFGSEFVTYDLKNQDGLVHQGWKDADDAVMTEDGESAAHPIALCEVQGYVYAARKEAAQLLSLLNRPGEAAENQRKAEEIKKKFNSEFWDDERETFALAIDGRGRKCRVVTSNALHVLSTGIADEGHVPAIENLWSGWGIRTMSSQEEFYSPLSYHNGSVWPHDNAMAVMGLARMGRKKEALQIFEGLAQAAQSLDYRLPELISGFRQRDESSPVRYPNACSPQAWAAGSVFLMLGALLGIRIDRKNIILENPVLPKGCEALTFSNLPVGEERVTLRVQQDEGMVSAGLIKGGDGVKVVVC